MCLPTKTFQAQKLTKKTASKIQKIQTVEDTVYLMLLLPFLTFRVAAGCVGGVCPMHAPTVRIVMNARAVFGDETSNTWLNVGDVFDALL